MRIIIHIGLHKTASTYLQQHVFPHLDNKKVIYNPDDIFYFINSIFTLNLHDEDRIKKAKSIARKYQDDKSNKILLISSEAISQLVFTQNYSEHIGLLYEIFEKPEIVIFFREQSKWLESCYKESIKHHFYQGIEDFLNYHDHDFQPIDSRLNKNNCLVMDAYKANWEDLAKTIKIKFENTHFFFYEDFRKDNLKETNRLLTILEHPHFEKTECQHSNPGFSSRSIQTLIKYHNLLGALGIKRKNYLNKYNKERDDIINNDYFWKPPKSGKFPRAARSLYKEPIRLLGRVSIYKILRIMDSMNPKRKKSTYLNKKLSQRIRMIHLESNKRLEAIVNRQVPNEYTAD